MNRLWRKAGPHQSALRTASPDGEALISIIPHLAHFFHCQPGKSVVLWIYYYKKEVARHAGAAACQYYRADL